MGLKISANDNSIVDALGRTITTKDGLIFIPKNDRPGGGGSYDGTDALVMADGLTFTTADGLVFVPNDYQVFTYNNRAVEEVNEQNKEEYILFRKVSSYINIALGNVPGLVLVDDQGRVLINDTGKILIQ